MKKIKHLGDFRGSDLEATLLKNRIRCSLCGKIYTEMYVTWGGGSVRDYCLHYNYSFPCVEPLSHRIVFRSWHAKDPASYRKMMTRKRITVDSCIRPWYAPYDRVVIRLECKCGGWRGMEVKTELKTPVEVRSEKPIYGV